MREIVFRVLEERPGHLMARSEDGTLLVVAPSREELHHEAREALMRQRGAAHVAFRIRLTRPPSLRPDRERAGHGRRARVPGSCRV